MAENRDWATRGSLHTSENENRDRIEATENINVFDDYSSNPDWTSEASSSADSDLEDYPLDERLQKPTEYFQELDSLESKVFENSMFQFYTVILENNLSIQMLNVGRMEQRTNRPTATFI
jgi:hypothetical protein